MTSDVLNITVDCHDPAAQARFWASVTGRVATDAGPPENPYWTVARPDGQWPNLVLVPVPEHKTIKNRMHVDLVPRGVTQAAELDRLLALGATVVDDRRESDVGGWVVMADPEGNEFCLEPG